MTTGTRTIAAVPLSLDLYQALWTYATDLITVLDLDGTFRYASPSYERILGHRPADLHGTSAFAIIHPDDRGATMAAFDTAVRYSGTPVTVTVRCRHADGTWRHIEATGSSQRDDPVVRGVVVNGRDVTSLRRLQDEFLAMASHELRTPLTPLQGYLELLSSLAPPGTPSARYTDAAMEQVERLKVLVGDLLDVGRLQTGKLCLETTRLDLGPVVTRAIAAARMESPGRMILFDSGPPVVVDGAAVRLEQVVLNLLRNAATYAPDRSRVEVRLWARDGSAELQVRDYGSGIAAADLPHIFSRFYQAARADAPSRQGLGLGLFIARELVTAHGGTIDVTSEEGCGTTFTVRLPLAAPR